MTPSEVLGLCRLRGVQLAASRGKLKFCGPASSVDDDLKGLLSHHKVGLLELLSVPPTGLTTEAWNTQAALALMSDTDATVERLGSHGTDPVIVRAADAVVAAHGRRDMASVRVGCWLVEERAKELADLLNRKG